MDNIILIGMMGSGKSTLSHQLSVMTGYQIVDTDDIIEKNENLKISEIFTKYGESYFRNLEYQFLKDNSFSKSIVSTGGGMILNQENCDRLRESGQVIYLKGDLETLYNRLTTQTGNRPLLDKEKLKNQLISLLEARENLYENTAHHVVCIDGKTSEAICREIYTFLREMDYKF